MATFRAEALGIVIQVRPVDERQVGSFLPQQLRGTASDPLGARESGQRSPEGVKGKRSQRLFQAVGQALGCAVDVEDLVAVGAVVRLGGHAEIDLSALIEPPEELGASKNAAPLGS